MKRKTLLDTDFNESELSNMNRREYLQRMGLAVATTIAGTQLEAFAMLTNRGGYHRTRTKNGRVLTAGRGPSPRLPAVASWPVGDKPTPDNFGVRLIFAGMMNFTHNGTEAHVAFHRGHTDTHKMQIIVSEKIGNVCKDIYMIGDGVNPASINSLEVGIKDKTSKANFFLGEKFEREKDVGDEKDFRWLIDLEELYKKRFHKTKVQFKAKLKVKHGTFYTYQRTNSTFVAKDGTPNDTKFGHVAKVMAADIPPLLNFESAYLRVNGKDVLPYPLTNRAKYEIYFFNERRSGNDPDFDMAFDAIDDINSSEKFKLVRLDKGDDDKTTGLCHNLPLYVRLNDEAPCMGGGFGGGGGFP